MIGGLPVVLKGPQVYVARTEALRRVRYDEHVRMVDHRDFFSMACGRMVFVRDARLVAFHARTPFNRAYVAYRDDVAADTVYLSRKWSGSSSRNGPGS
jgi:beta-1,4-N-acetylgalactosaminyltransferase 2